MDRAQFYTNWSSLDNVGEEVHHPGYKLPAYHAQAMLAPWQGDCVADFVWADMRAAFFGEQPSAPPPPDLLPNKNQLGTYFDLAEKNIFPDTINLAGQAFLRSEISGPEHQAYAMSFFRFLGYQLHRLATFDPLSEQDAIQMFLPNIHKVPTAIQAFDIFMSIEENRIQKLLLKHKGTPQFSSLALLQEVKTAQKINRKLHADLFPATQIR